MLENVHMHKYNMHTNEHVVTHLSLILTLSNFYQKLRDCISDLCHAVNNRQGVSFLFLKSGKHCVKEENESDRLFPALYLITINLTSLMSVTGLL